MWNRGMDQDTPNRHHVTPKKKRAKLAEASAEADPLADLCKDEKRQFPTNPNLCTNIPMVPEETMTLYCNRQVVETGKAFFQKKQPTVVIARGDYVMADLEDHVPTIKCAQDGRVISARCTCNSRYWCEHVVATLMYCFYKPDKVVTEENVAKLLKEIEDHESLNAVLMRLLLKMPSRLYTELDSLRRQYSTRKTVRPTDEIHDNTGVDELQAEWTEAFSKAEEISSFHIPVEDIARWARSIFRVCVEGQVFKAFELAADITDKLKRCKQHASSLLNNSMNYMHGYADYDSASDSDDSNPYIPRPMRDSTEEGRRDIILKMWRHLLLFATCPFVGLDMSAILALNKIAEMAGTELFPPKFLSYMHWNNPDIKQAMASGLSSTNLLHIEPATLLRARISILALLSRFEEAVNLANAAGFDVLAAELSMGGWQTHYKASGAAKSTQDSEESKSLNPAIQRALSTISLSPAEALAMAKSMHDTDFTGAFLLARRGIQSDSQDTCRVLEWLVKEHLNLDLATKFNFNPTDANERVANNCVFPLLIQVSQKLAGILNNQVGTSIEEVLRSVPIDVQRVVMLDLLVDTINGLPYSYRPSYMNSDIKSNASALAETLTTLASFLVKQSFVAHAIEFLLSAATRSIDYMPLLMKLARSQGPDCFARTMRRMLTNLIEHPCIPQAGSIFSYARMCMDYGFKEIGIEMAVHYIHIFNYAQSRVAKWILKKAMTVSREFAREIARKLMDFKSYMSKNLNSVPIIYAVAHKAYKLGFIEDAFEGCLQLCDEVYASGNFVADENKAYGTHRSSKIRYYSSHGDDYVILSDDDENEKNYQTLVDSSFPFFIQNIRNFNLDEESVESISENLFPFLLTLAKEVDGGMQRIDEFMRKKLITNRTTTKFESQDNTIEMLELIDDLGDDIESIISLAPSLGLQPSHIDNFIEFEDDEYQVMKLQKIKQALLKKTADTSSITFEAQFKLVGMLFKHDLESALPLASYVICKAFNKIFAYGSKLPQASQPSFQYDPYSYNYRLSSPSSDLYIESDKSISSDIVFSTRLRGYVPNVGEISKANAQKEAQLYLCAEVIKRLRQALNLPASEAATSSSTNQTPRRSTRTKSPAKNADDAMDVEEIQETPRRRGRAKSTATRATKSRKRKRSSAASAAAAEAPEAIEILSDTETPQQNGERRVIGLLDAEDASPEDVLIAALTLQFLTEPTVERFVELRKNSTNLWFGELTRFEGLPFLDGILSLLSPCHPLKVMILLHDEKIDEALQLVAYDFTPQDSYNMISQIPSLRRHQLGSALENPNNKRIPLLVHFLNAATHDEKIRHAILKPLAKEIEHYVWRPWAPSASTYHTTAHDQVRTLDHKLEMALSEARWLPNQESLLEVHMVLSDLRSMHVPAGRQHYLKLRKALERAKDVCERHKRLDEWTVALEAVRESQSNRTACITILKDLK